MGLSEHHSNPAAPLEALLDDASSDAVGHATHLKASPWSGGRATAERLNRDRVEALPSEDNDAHPLDGDLTVPSATYELVKGNLHRHGELRHAHPHTGPHEHYSHHRHEHPRDHRREHEHGHSHGLVDESIKRSREGVRAVVLALAILTVTAAVQAVVFALSGSLALLADLIHNGGDALTAIPLGIAFALRSQRAERLAGLAVVAVIFISACVAAYESIVRLLHPSTPGHLLALVLAGAIGFAGNWLAALVDVSASLAVYRKG